MRPSDKGQQMVLTHRIQGDILHQHQLLVAPSFVEDLQVLLGVRIQAREDLLIHPGHPGRGLLQALPVRVLPHGL